MDEENFMYMCTKSVKSETLLIKTFPLAVSTFVLAQALDRNWATITANADVEDQSVNPILQIAAARTGTCGKVPEVTGFEKLQKMR